MTKNQLLIKFALRFRFSIILSLIFGFASAIFNGVGITLIIPVILSVIDENMMSVKAMPPILSKPMAFFEHFSGEWRILAMLGTILTIIILKNVTNVVDLIINSKFTKNLSNDIRKEVLKILMEVDLDFFQTNKTGTLLSNLENESNRTAGSIQTALQMVTISFNLFTFISILVSISWQLTLLTVFLLFLLSLTNQIFIKKARFLGEKLREITRIYSQKLLETFSGIRLIKSMSQEKKEYFNIVELMEKREKLSLDSELNSVFIAPINEVGGISIIIFIILIGRYLFFEEIRSLATILLTYLLVLFRAIPLVGAISRSRTSYANKSSSVEVIYDFLNRENKPFLPQGNRIYQTLKNGIKFDNVFFSYPNQNTLVLQNINLFIPQGKVTALVGASGSGKSTLSDLLARFYDPTQGQILIDNIPYQEFDLSSIRKFMGMVSQDTFLFNKSVRYNICYGLENVTEERLTNAIKRANAFEFIIDLPEQLETEIGDRGVMLSGGQRQRLAIARALLRNPEILILDEATSALDTVSENLVQQAMEELYKERTTLVIAHRLSTIRNADQIVVLNEGKIMEIGTHDQLLAKDGYYAELYNLQFGKSGDLISNFS